ncbi:hypothetical protein CHUAL_013520 [Chamberlinius hualienensis]
MKTTTQHWRDHCPLSLQSNYWIVVAISLIVITIFLLIWLSIFCKTGWGCRFLNSCSPCCSLICRPEEIEDELKEILLKNVPGGIYDSEGNISSVYHPSEKERNRFSEAVDQLRRL